LQFQRSAHYSTLRDCPIKDAGNVWGPSLTLTWERTWGTLKSDARSDDLRIGCESSKSGGFNGRASSTNEVIRFEQQLYVITIELEALEIGGLRRILEFSNDHFGSWPSSMAY
jgi:hypothetical protein